MTAAVFDMHLLVPSTLHDAGDASRIVAVVLVVLHLQRRLGMPGINADDRHSQPGPHVAHGIE